MRMELAIGRCTAYLSVFSCWWFITFWQPAIVVKEEALFLFEESH
jgi:hypothetical protein